MIDIVIGIQVKQGLILQWFSSSQSRIHVAWRSSDIVVQFLYTQSYENLQLNWCYVSLV